MKNIDAHSSFPDSGLDDCDHAIFKKAREIGVGGALFMFAGAIGLIASSGQMTWDIARSAFLVMFIFGGSGVMIAEVFLRILRKHRHKHLPIFF